MRTRVVEYPINKNHIITFPVKDSNGDIRYKGEMFTMKEMVIN